MFGWGDDDEDKPKKKKKKKKAQDWNEVKNSPGSTMNRLKSRYDR
jgi:hypothetical protein